MVVGTTAPPLSSTCPAVGLFPDVGDIIFSAQTYGGTGGIDRIAFDQGRINGIAKWGTYPNRRIIQAGALIIKEWSSDAYTFGADPYEFGESDEMDECAPFQLSADDFIIGATVYWRSDATTHNNYVYGLDFYTKNEETYSCKNDAILAVVESENGLVVSTEYYDTCLWYDIFNSDQVPYYYQLIGFQGHHGLVIDNIEFQWKHIEKVRTPSTTSTETPTTTDTDSCGPIGKKGEGKIFQVESIEGNLMFTISFIIDCNTGTVTMDVTYPVYNDNWFGVIFNGYAMIYTTGKNDNRANGLYSYDIH